jgi:hypothetical protein
LLETIEDPSEDVHEYASASPSGSLTPCAENVKIVADTMPVPKGETLTLVRIGGRLAAAVGVVGVPPPQELRAMTITTR